MRWPRPPRSTPPQHARPARALALLVLLTALALSPALLADFVRLDDYSHLFDNPHLQGRSLSGLAALWVKPYFNLYIPVTYSVWWAATLVGGLWGPLKESAWLFHGLNLAVHVTNAALVFALLRRLLDLAQAASDPRAAARSCTVALLAALVFALHPMQVETVAWVSELKGGLSTGFGLLGLWWYYRSPKRLPTAICFVAAMLAKPSAIVFPGVLLLIDRILLGRSLRKSVTGPALYGLLLLPLLLVTKHLQPDSMLDVVPTPAQRLVVAADALAFYVTKVVFPFPLAVDYGRSPQLVLGDLPGWRLGLLALLSVAGVAVVVYALARPRPRAPDATAGVWLLCGWSIFLLALAPVLGLVPFGFQQFSTVADHYVYLPLLGLGVMVVGLLIRLGPFVSTRWVAAVVLAACAVLSFQQAGRWRSNESLFAHTVRVNPRSYLACQSLAEEHLHGGRYDEAIAWATRALAIRPDYVNAQLTLALGWSQQGEAAKALALYESFLARNPSTVGTRARLVASLHNNLGMLLARSGRTAEAVEHFRTAIAIFPRSLNAHLNLGNLALQEGRYLDAIAELETAQALNPGNAFVAGRLAQARAAARRPPSEASP